MSGVERKVSTLDPFELLEPIEASSKQGKYLTLTQIRDIVDIQIRYIENLPPQIWGFTRDDIIENLEELFQELSILCRHN